MFNGATPSIADIAAVTGGNRNNDGFGDGGWWAWIILFALFGWGGNGFGFGGNGQGGVGAEVQRGFDTASITTKLDGINTGFAQLDRTINDKFCELEMRQMQQTINEQQSLIQSLNLAQSQANQNQYLISQLRPCPTPAYLTCNPWATNGTSYNGCNGCGC